MATALQCPACGHKHRLDGPRVESSFPCTSCGQPLKVPAQFRGTPSAPAGSTNGAPTPVAAAAPMTTRPIIGHNQHKLKSNAAPAPVPDVLDHAGYDDGFVPDEPFVDDVYEEEFVGAAAPRQSIGAKVRLTRSQRRAVMDRPLPWWGRLLSWLVAFPLAALLTLVPMRIVHFFSGSYMLGLLSETGVRRYGRLAVALIAWALVTAVIVQAISWFVRRRRIQHIQESAGATVDLALHEELAV